MNQEQENSFKWQLVLVSAHRTSFVISKVIGALVLLWYGYDDFLSGLIDNAPLGHVALGTWFIAATIAALIEFVVELCGQWLRHA